MGRGRGWALEIVFLNRLPKPQILFGIVELHFLTFMPHLYAT
jgi:hypothetical protein